MQELIDSSSSFVRCPNKQCRNAIERVKSQENTVAKEMVSNFKIYLSSQGPDGKVLSPESIKHRNEYRFRCRECNTEFCSSCQSVPYHLGELVYFIINFSGFTCEKVIEVFLVYLLS